HAVGPLEAGQGVGFLVFAAYAEQNTHAAQFPQVFLEFGIGHAGGSFAAQHDALGAVVADDAAPQGVVQVAGHQLFVFAQQALDDVGHALAQIGDAVDGAGILVGVPCGLAGEVVHTVHRLQIGQVVHIEVGGGGGVVGQFLVH